LAHLVSNASKSLATLSNFTNNTLSKIEMNIFDFYSLSDIFEDRQKDLFGEHGFGNIVYQVEDLAKKLDLYEISQFTPGK
jgi:hypothetical protein